MLVVTFLVFSFGSLEAHNETASNFHLKCSTTKKCPNTVSPLCATVEHHENVYIPKYIKVQNLCEMDRLKCHKDVKVATVPIQACLSFDKNKDLLDSIGKQKITQTKINMQIIEVSLKSKNKDMMSKLGEYSPAVRFAFVVDVGEPNRELRKIQSTMKAMADLVYNDASKYIKDLLLTVYAWPVSNATFVTRTKDVDDFSHAVDWLLPRKTSRSDCSLNIFQATITAMQKAERDTKFYVFVNGMPSKTDATLYSEIIRLSEERDIEVNFVVTGNCSQWLGFDAVYEQFFDIAGLSQGQVLRMDSEYLEKVLLGYVTATVLEYQRQVVVSEKLLKSQFAEIRIPFQVTEEHEFVTVSVSGEDIHFIVSNDRNNSVDFYEPVVNMAHIKVQQYRALDVGQYYVRLYSKHLTRCGLITVATSNVELEYEFGFSLRKDVNSLLSYSPAPRAGNSVYVVIKVISPNNKIALQHVEFIDLEGKLIAKYAIDSAEDSAYEDSDILRTDLVEITSDKRFNVAVVGIHAETKKLARIINHRVVRPYKVHPDEKKSDEDSKPVNDGKGSYEDKPKGQKGRVNRRGEGGEETVKSDSSEDSQTEERTTVRSRGVKPKLRIKKTNKYRCNTGKRQFTIRKKCRVVGDKPFSMKFILKDKSGVISQSTKKTRVKFEVGKGKNPDYEKKLTCIVINEKTKKEDDRHTITVRCPTKIGKTANGENGKAKHKFRGKKDKNNHSSEDKAEGGSDDSENEYTDEEHVETDAKIKKGGAKHKGWKEDTYEEGSDEDETDDDTDADKAYPHKPRQYASNVVVTVGGYFRVTCPVHAAKPNSPIKWLFKSSKSSSFKLLKDKAPVLVRLSVGLRDAGLYQCVFTTPTGKYTHTINVSVYDFGKNKLAVPQPSMNLGICSNPESLKKLLTQKTGVSAICPIAKF